jgi:hypothetical protein
MSRNQPTLIDWVLTLKHGDTDIFPFSLETHFFFDRYEDLCNHVVEYNDNSIVILSHILLISSVYCIP